MKIKKYSGIFLLMALLICGCSSQYTSTSSDSSSSSSSSDSPNSSESTGSSNTTTSTGSQEHIHSFGDWIIDYEATDFTEGRRHRVCEVCLETVSEIIPFTLDFPRVYINYQDLYPEAPAATDYAAFADWTWDYLTVPFTYRGYRDDESANFSSFAKMRIQGATSKAASYLKKNYAIKLYEDRQTTVKNKVKLVDSWGEQSKYVLKANWIDVTSARNLVNADLWSEVVDSRKESRIVSPRKNIETLVNNGAIDGFPVMLYFNDDYFGLYTLNIPKDKWLFGMKKDAKQALLFADGSAESEGAGRESTAFKETIVWNNSLLVGSGWEVEYAYDETQTAWMAQSMNKAIQLVIDTYGAMNKNPALPLDKKKQLRDKFLSEADKYLDLDGCIDYMIFLHCIQGFPDNSTKNVLWSTFDGNVWTPNAYDLDTTWGLAYNGEMNVFENRLIDPTSGGFWRQASDSWYRANLRGNHLFEAILLFSAEKAQARYNELRQGPLSYENIAQKFSTFIEKIPTVLQSREISDFSSRPSEQVSSLTQQKNSTDLNQILSYADRVLSFMDGQYNGPNLDFNIHYFD